MDSTIKKQIDPILATQQARGQEMQNSTYNIQSAINPALMTSSIPVNIPTTIPSDVLATNKTNLQVPDLTPTNAQSKFNTSLTSATAPVVPAPVAPEVSDRDRILNQVTEYSKRLNDPTTGKSARTNQLNSETGLNDATAKLNQFQAQDIALQNQLAKFKEEQLYKNPQGLYGGGAQQLVSQEERFINQARTDLAIQKLAVQGDISTAQNLIKNQLAAEFEPLEKQIEYDQKFYTMYGDDLTEKQKEEYTIQSEERKAKKAENDKLLSYIDDAGKNGAPVEVQNEAKKLFLNGQRAEGVAMLAKYSQKAAVDSLTPLQKFQTTQALAKDTEQRTQKAQEMVRQSGIMNTALNNLKKGGDKSVATQAIIATFNKILDPTSTVREGEYDRTVTGQSLIERMNGKIGAIVNGGGGVTDETLADAVSLANEYLTGAKESIQVQNERARSMAEQFGLNPDNVTSTGYQPKNPALTEIESNPAYKKLTPEQQQRYKESRGLNKVGGDTNKASDKEVVAGYDITSYATDPTHGKKVSKIYNNIPEVNAPEDVDSYISKIAPNSPVKGSDVIASARKYGVDPKLVIALMVQDSTLGTKGLAVRTKNPGNVGNTDSGATKTFANWSEGVDAVAKNLSWRKNKA